MMTRVFDTMGFNLWVQPVLRYNEIFGGNATQSIFFSAAHLVTAWKCTEQNRGEYLVVYSLPRSV